MSMYIKEILYLNPSSAEWFAKHALILWFIFAVSERLRSHCHLETSNVSTVHWLTKSNLC